MLSKSCSLMRFEVEGTPSASAVASMECSWAYHWRLPKLHPGAQVRPKSLIDGSVDGFTCPSKRECVAPADCGDKCVKDIRFDASLESRGENTLTGGGGLGLGHWQHKKFIGCSACGCAGDIAISEFGHCDALHHRCWVHSMRCPQKRCCHSILAEYQTLQARSDCCRKQGSIYEF